MSEDQKNEKKTQSKKDEIQINNDDQSELSSKSKKPNLIIDDTYIETFMSKVSLNEQQKNEVKELLTKELDAAISSVKEKVANESQEIKKDFLTMFGIFVSFLTFISIEVQLFKTNNNLTELLGLSSLILSFLMLFALLLTHLSKAEFSFKDLIKPIYLVTYSFLIAGVVLLMSGNSISKTHHCLNNQIQKNQKAIKFLNEKIIELRKKNMPNE